MEGSCEMLHTASDLAGFCEHGNEPSRSIKGGGFLDHMSDCQFPKKDPTSWSYLVDTAAEACISWSRCIVWTPRTFVVHGIYTFDVVINRHFKCASLS